METPSTLGRYHQVLLAVSSSVGGLSLQELAQRTRLPRSTAYRIAAALCAVGYLEAEEGRGAYTLGPSLQQIIRRSLVADNRLRAFQPAIEFLVARLNETAFFARLMDDGEVDLVKAVTPHSNERSYIYPGTGSRPLDKCSSSKAILAYIDPKQVETYLLASKIPGASDPNVQLKPLLAQLHQVKRNGYAICDGEIDEGVCSISVPVPVGTLFGLFSMGVVGPSARMKERPLTEIVEIAHEAAAIASRNLLESANDFS